MTTYGSINPPARAKSEESEKLANDVDAFIRRSGRIDEVPCGTSGVATGAHCESGEFKRQRGRAARKAREYHRRKAMYE